MKRSFISQWLHHSGTIKPTSPLLTIRTAAKEVESERNISAGWFQIPPCPGCTVCCWPEQQVTIQATCLPCSSNEKCLAVNEINTDIKSAQQELQGKKRSQRKREVGERGKEGGGWVIKASQQQKGDTFILQTNDDPSFMTKLIRKKKHFSFIGWNV